MTACTFTLAWIGECGREDCTVHANLKCSCCGAPATHECEETFGGNLCGAFLCGDCEHQLTADGTNAPALMHCRKSDQTHTPWWKRQETA
ncbi:hypothetical protein [Acuticoccus sediminis]|uniref:hypothetical protein n=1 Tax=Acuticoccus sediminis TaxID=2184697 RepID=UPI001CFECD9D|nr:hypothetical protein [Acuticoccus sediminis]